MAAVALVQGASRGLGLDFCKYLLLNKSTASVIATCRNPDTAQYLAALSAQHAGRMTVLKLDVNKEDDIKRAAENVKSAFGKVDLIINSSAMLHPSGKGETSLRDVSAQVTNGPFISIDRLCCGANSNAIFTCFFFFYREPFPLWPLIRWVL